MFNNPGPAPRPTLLIKSDPPIVRGAGPGREDSTCLTMGLALSKFAFAISKFTLFNSVLNTVDVGTDIKTFFDLLRDGHKYWASLTMLWTLCPFFVHLTIFLKNWAQNGKAGAFWNEVGVHLPFATPLRNLCYAYKLLSYGYGHPNYYDRTKARDVEEIMSKAGMTSQAESFCEAGPQATTQMIIMMSTGRYTPTQLISVAVSILSLSWGAARAYFILRTRDQSDPDPAVGMVIKWILMHMVAVTVHSLLMWSTIGGLLGPYTFVAIPITILAIYTVVRTNDEDFETGVLKELEEVDASTSDPDVQPAKAAKKENSQDKNPNENTNEDAEIPEDFAMPAALFSVWLPCVVGNRAR